MKNEQKLVPTLVFPDGEPSDPDPISIGSVTIVTNIGGRDRVRPAEEIEKLAEFPIESVADACRKYDVRITGQYQDLDGEIVEASIPVLSEETFTPDGITRGDPGIREMYIQMRTFDALAAHLAEKGRDCLTDAEIEHLRATMAILEQAVAEDVR